jgi:hypothetical protein
MSIWLAWGRVRLLLDTGGVYTISLSICSAVSSDVREGALISCTKRCWIAFIWLYVCVV